MNIKPSMATLAAMLALATAPAFSQQDAATDTAALVARYPAGSIDSVEKAQQVLQETANQRAAIERQYTAEEAECAQKFFVNACADAAKERRRSALKQVRPIEIEADTFQRKARVIERDKALADRAAQEEQEKPERLKQQQENEAAAAQRAASKAAEAKPERAPVPDKRSAQHDAKVRQLQAEEVANAQKRAENIANYNAKVKEAQEHQREVAARKREKENERAEKERAAQGEAAPGK